MDAINDKVDDLTQTEAAQTEAPAESESETEPETIDPDSILMNTDDSALGEGVTIDATAPEAVPETQLPLRQSRMPDLRLPQAIPILTLRHLLLRRQPRPYLPRKFPLQMFPLPRRLRRMTAMWTSWAVKPPLPMCLPQKLPFPRACGR